MKSKFGLVDFEKSNFRYAVDFEKSATSEKIDKLISDDVCIAEIDQHGVSGSGWVGNGSL